MRTVMGRRTDEDMEWDDDESGESESDAWSDEEEEPTVPCPYCGREIYEDAPQCPYCQQYIVDDDAAPSRKPWWIVIGVLLCILAIWLWTVY